ncbi:MAG: hypothetical protein RSC31_06990 [Anaerovoracaceae bacterium]
MGKKINILIIVFALIGVLVFAKWPASIQRVIDTSMPEALSIGITLKDSVAKNDIVQFSQGKTIYSKKIEGVDKSVMGILDDTKYARRLFNGAKISEKTNGLVIVRMKIADKTIEMDFYDEKNLSVNDGITTKYYMAKDDIYSELMKFYDTVKQ